MECESEVVEVDAVTRQINVSIAADKFDKESEAALSGHLKRVQLKGFRPGKAPRQLIEKMHGEEIRFEVAQRLAVATLGDLIREHKLEVVGEPDVNLDKIQGGKDLKFTAKVFLFPNPTVKGYEKLKVKIAKREVAATAVDGVINRMLERKAVTKEVTSRNIVQKGDVVSGSVVVTVEGQEASGSEPFTLVIGNWTFPVEVEEGIVGMQLGETKEIDGKLPYNYPDAAIRGKIGKFKVTVAGISEKIMPELTDALAKSLGMEVETVLELRAKVSKQLEEINERESKKDIQAAALDGLIKENEFIVPQVLVDDEIRELLARSGLVDLEKVDLRKVSAEPFRKDLGEAALKRVKSAVIVDAIARQESIKPSDEDINKALDEIARENAVSIDDVRRYVLSAERQSGFYAELTRGKVLELLVERAEVEYLDLAAKESESKAE